MTERSKEMKAAATLYRQGLFEEAESGYTRALAIGPRDYSALVRLGEIAMHRNRPDEAMALFRRASEHAPSLMRFWPLSSHLKESMAMAHYRGDRFAEAAGLFKGAAGPLPLGSLRHWKALGEYMGCFEDPPYVIEGPRETRVTFATVDPLPVLEVSLCGGKSAFFFIDTGAAEVMLDEHLAREVGAQIVARIRGESAGPGGVVGLGRMESLEIGEFVIRNVPIHTLNMTGFAEVFGGLAVKGILGTRLLMHFLSTIDYAQGFLSLNRKSPSPYAHHKGIPFWLIGTHYMVAWGTVNGRGPMLLLVDTGLGGMGFSAAVSTLRQAGIAVDWATAEQGVGGFGKVKAVNFIVDELALGTGSDRLVQHNVPGIAFEKTVSVLGYRLGFHLGGMISHEFFRRSALTFDFDSMKLLVA